LEDSFLSGLAHRDTLDFSHLLPLEVELDACLVDHRTQQQFTPEWLHAGERWSDTVWELVGQAANPPDDAVLDATIAFARRPTFICGAHRSGTTLVRDLLDGHPALCVLPAEASYFGAMERKVASRTWDQRLSFVGREWLRRLVNPINQPPFWLLGRSTESTSPYADFARCYANDATLLRDALVPAADLAAIACAFAKTRGQAVHDLAWWIEKTPGTERHLPRIWQMFPQARIIHVVRDPKDAAASYRALLPHSNGDAAAMTAVLREMIRSYRICRHFMRAAPDDQYLIVSYDALVGDRVGTMRRVARFLGIADHPALQEQSVAGLPASPNSSYAAPFSRPRPWSTFERACLEVARIYYRKVMRDLV
jgi:hypothetical protein